MQKQGGPRNSSLQRVCSKSAKTRAMEESEVEEEVEEIQEMFKLKSDICRS